MNRLTFSLGIVVIGNIVGAYRWALSHDPYMLAGNAVGVLGFGLLAIASRD